MTAPSSGFLSRASAAHSRDGAALARLTPEQRDRLTDVLDRYLSSLEQDVPLAQETLLAEHPDLADALRSYFRSLEDLHDMAAGFSGAPQRDQAPQQESHEGTRRIGDFELIREVGRGGMGVVYEAQQISLDRRVAVKLLPFAAVLDAKQIARFKHEAQAAAQLHHPHIVPVFAIGVERGVHYYAMQFVDGCTLAEYIAELARTSPKRKRGADKRQDLRTGGNGGNREARSKGNEDNEAGRDTTEGSKGSKERHQFESLLPLLPSVLSASSPFPAFPRVQSPVDHSAETARGCASTIAAASRLAQEQFRRVAELGIQAAEALHAAHEYGVVHRDVKPSNLLLAADGKLWVTDFGLARFQRDASLTRTGDLVGTMRYMSPEQASGQSALVDQRTDIYSLGVTLYELACLKPAFDEERGPALLRQIDSADPPRPRQVRPDVPADLETVILKAMSRERDDRYSTAQQLADDLRCVLEGKATQARPITTLDRLGRWTRRHRRLVLAGVATLMIAVLGLLANTIKITDLSQRATASAQRADRLYKDAREMLDRLGIQIAQQLEDVPEADPARQHLLDQTRRYYLRFIDETKNDPVLRIDAAMAYGKLGTLLELLGSPAESLAAHEKAAEVLDQLVAAHPGDFKIERQLAVTENNLGLALKGVGKTDQARQQLEQAIRRQEKLLARQPRDAALEAELALSQCNLGLLQFESHQAAQAQVSLTAALDHFKPAIAAWPDDDQYRRKLAATYSNLAAGYQNDRPLEAAELHGQALDLLQAASRANPSDLALRRDMGTTLNNLGASLARAGQAEAARKAYERAIEIREELVRLAPARATYHGDLAASLNNLGLLQNRSDQADEAEATFRRALELYESLLTQLPSNAAIQSNLGGVYNNLGVTLERKEQLEAAALAFASAVTHQQTALQLAPDLPRCRELLIKHYESQGRVLNKLGRAADAVQAKLAMERLVSLPHSNRQEP